MDKVYVSSKMITSVKTNTSCKMYNSTASKIMKSIDHQPPFLVPNPMSYDGVDETGNHNAVYQVSNKVAPFCQGS